MPSHAAPTGAWGVSQALETSGPHSNPGPTTVGAEGELWGCASHSESPYIFKIGFIISIWQDSKEQEERRWMQMDQPGTGGSKGEGGGDWAHSSCWASCVSYYMKEGSKQGLGNHSSGKWSKSVKFSIKSLKICSGRKKKIKSEFWTMCRDRRKQM